MYNKITPVVKNIIILNVIFFMAQELMPNGLGEKFTQLLALHVVGGTGFEIYQYVTSIFLHGSLSHMVMNMFALWMFGSILEYDLGSKKFLIYYLVAGIGAGVLHSGIMAWELKEVLDLTQAQLLNYSPADREYAAHVKNIITVGASGSVFGILLGYGVLHPNDRIMLLIPPIPMKAKYFVIIYGLIELISGFVDSRTNIAHFAHVGGMLFGYLLLAYWKKSFKIWR